MEIKQEKKEERSPVQEQKDSQLQGANFAARAERNGPQIAQSGDQGGSKPRETNLADVSSSQPSLREAGLRENRNKSMESKALNVPEGADKKKLKEQ